MVAKNIILARFMDWLNLQIKINFTLKNNWIRVLESRGHFIQCAKFIVFFSLQKNSIFVQRLLILSYCTYTMTERHSRPIALCVKVKINKCL